MLAAKKAARANGSRARTVARRSAAHHSISTWKPLVGGRCSGAGRRERPRGFASVDTAGKHGAIPTCVPRRISAAGPRGVARSARGRSVAGRRVQCPYPAASLRRGVISFGESRWDGVHGCLEGGATTGRLFIACNGAGPWRTDRRSLLPSSSTPRRGTLQYGAA